MGLEDDRGEQLDPVGDELPTIRLTNLAGLGVDAKAASAVTSYTRGAHGGGAGADGVEGLRDPRATNW